MVYSGRFWCTRRRATLEGITPTVHRIVSTIEDRIHSRRYQSGDWLPTERALGEEFGVSRATIRRAISELERRTLLVRSTGCRPLVRDGSHPRRRLALRKSIGLWISSDPTDVGASVTTMGVQRALDHDVFRLVVAGPYGDQADDPAAAEARALDRMAADADVVGILLWYTGGTANLGALKALREARVPLVFIDRKPPAGFEADHVGIDNISAAEQVVAHLNFLGHRTIAHITGTDNASTISERLQGYKNGLDGANLRYSPDLVVTDQQMERLLTLKNRPTAIFAVNDHSAFGAVDMLRKNGLSVPDDVAVAGFDDQERSSHHTPFLTSIHQP
ncbi:MAG TPA: GntR family transcriptional regulator, partial [Chthonomonadales bacterium]|nr:GntR family transcriptional regulator [Chthonomonadales bacterium]